ncbi:superoxide dismutase family protein [Sphingobium subterraneum]|uniref:Superoxide dismutase [Cu-Zn] n=1 Tax=Sphingobium subterraneum TaxID=627688 RepID=A0A841J1T4_9SPHN|nr:superoxide dismutase family protein [Sphingobium subterraneum]MBB6125139.1 Cu-Zn family superoxide dismutase [Sphingobium subterraneum]
MASRMIHHAFFGASLIAAISVPALGTQTLSAMVSPPADRPQATASLLAADGSARGTVTLVQTSDGVDIAVKASGLAPGTHGIHIHTVGSCTPPDFASAGAHWNPTMHQHGVNNPEGPHRGDMPNLIVDAKGIGTMDFSIARATLKGGDAPLLDADGAAVVMHAGPDDMRTDPSGNSGGREACGVITAQ